MQKLPAKYIWTIVLFSTTAHGQSPDSLKDDVIENRDIFRRMVWMETVNDFVYLLGLGTNDEGYTAGISVGGRIPQINQNRYFDIFLRSKLYTRQAGNRYRNKQGLAIKPQYFTEISFLSFSYSKYNPKKKLIFCTQAGIGLYNRKEPIPPLALFLQGGADGKGGFHELLGPEQERQDNVSTGEANVIFRTQFSVKKFYSFTKKEQKDAAYISLEPGGRVVFPLLQGSQLFFNMYAMVPIIQAKNKHKTKFRIAALWAGDLSLHPNGLLFVPKVGLEISLFFLRLSYTNMFILGQQQNSYIRYSDDEPMMKIGIQIAF